MIVYNKSPQLPICVKKYCGNCLNNMGNSTGQPTPTQPVFAASSGPASKTYKFANAEEYQPTANIPRSFMASSAVDSNKKEDTAVPVTYIGTYPVLQSDREMLSKH